ncbi:MAG: cyclophilin family peptidyl-prolyl cis-trans isomerase [Pseudohongiellaceae bacterium]|jgi:cyclophilin family peptidyl-prolyl cis-trans isomerase
MEITMRALVLTFILAFGLTYCTEGNSTEIQESSTSALAEIAEVPLEDAELRVEELVTDNDAPKSTELVTAMKSNPTVLINTNKGNITIELWADKAPISVENFLRYSDSGFYDGLIFHRVIPGFMAQGGGFDQDMVQKSGFEPIKNEAKSDVPNNRGTLAMARTNVVDSASSQFFINLVDNNFLNHTDETDRGFGYAVFAEVVEGMDIVDLIAGISTGRVRGFSDVPNEAVIINSVTRED